MNSKMTHLAILKTSKKMPFINEELQMYKRGIANVRDRYLYDVGDKRLIFKLTYNY